VTDTSLATVLERGVLARNAVPLSFWEGAALLVAVFAVAVVAAYLWSLVAEGALSADAAGEGAE
jgi:Na+/H+ antiporter NhaD/arsenite permease-like protein